MRRIFVGLMSGNTQLLLCFGNTQLAVVLKIFPAARLHAAGVNRRAAALAWSGCARQVRHCCIQCLSREFLQFSAARELALAPGSFCWGRSSYR
jgi:hypothetical protein